MSGGCEPSGGISDVGGEVLISAVGVVSGCIAGSTGLGVTTIGGSDRIGREDCVSESALGVAKGVIDGSSEGSEPVSIVV